MTFTVPLEVLYYGVGLLTGFGFAQILSGIRNLPPQEARGYTPTMPPPKKP